MSKNLRIGVCLLDDPATGNGPGSAVVDGEFARVNSISELARSRNLLWISNLDYETYKRHGHFKREDVKPDQVLRSRIENLQKEFGIQNLASSEAAHFLSRIAQSTIDYSAIKTNAPIDEINAAAQRLDWVIKPRVRPEARQPKAADAPSISVAMDSHMFNYAVYPAAGDLVKRFYTVPRTTMARVLLQSLPYPSLWTPWEYIEFKRPVYLSPGSKLPAELDGRAAIVRVEINKLRPERREWAPFTKRREKGAQFIPRNWIALPEALSYAEDAEVGVIAAYVTALEPLKLPHALPSIEDDGMISAQLFAESCLYAMGAKTGIDRYRKPIATGHCAMAAYMWAYERAYMSKIAKLFQAKGMGQITTVGSLQLQVQMMPNMIPRADLFAFTYGLEPPMTEVDADWRLSPYVAYEPLERRDSRSIATQTMTVDDWIHNPKALVHHSAFSFLKAAGSLHDILASDALSADPATRGEAHRIHAKAAAAVSARITTTLKVAV
jgi:hypothetical protein